jgi:hypothetical protein
LILIAGFELAADFSLLLAAWRERAGSILPLPSPEGAVEERYGWVSLALHNLQRRLLVWIMSVGVVPVFVVGLSFKYVHEVPLVAIYILGGLACYYQVSMFSLKIDCYRLSAKPRTLAYCGIYASWRCSGVARPSDGGF